MNKYILKALPNDPSTLMSRFSA